MNENEKSKAHTAQTVLAEVASVLEGASGDVRSKLVSLLTDRVVTTRVELLDKALVKRKDLAKEVEKIRPKKVFNADGSEAPGTFTNEEFQSLKKAKDKLGHFDSALEQAFAGDAKGFEKLTQAMGNNPNSAPAPAE